MSKKHKHNRRPDFNPQSNSQAPQEDLTEEVLEEQEELEASEQEILCPPDCSEPKDDAEWREEQPEQEVLAQEDATEQLDEPQEELPAEEPQEGSEEDRHPELAEGSQGQDESSEEAPQEEAEPEQPQEEPAEEPMEEQSDEAPIEEQSFEQPEEEPLEEQPQEEVQEQPAEENAVGPEEDSHPELGSQEQEEPLEEAPQDVIPQDEPIQELTDEQKAEAEAQAKEEKARKKAERAAKTREWFKKHIALVVSLSLVVLLAAGLCTGHFVMTRNVAFIHSADGLQKAIAKGKKTEYVFKNDVIWTGDLSLDGVNLDLNDHTLEVKGNLNLGGDGFVGYKKFIWSKPQVGGKVIVEGNLTMTGTRDLYSEFTVSGQVTGIDLNVYGDLGAASVILSGNLDVEGKIDSMVTLGGNALVNGEVATINGGREVVAHGKIGRVMGADELYVYPESDVEAYSEVGNAYFVQYLEAPMVYVSKDANGNQMLVISHVLNADRYSIEISGIADADTVKKGAGDNTLYVLPDLDPGDYTVTVKPVSDQPKIYVSRDVTSVKVSYFVQLATPVFGIESGVDAEGNLAVTVNIAPVEHAAAFVVSVNGTERRINAADGAVSLSIGDLITEVGTYNVTVYAVQPSGNYRDSEKALKSYVHTATTSLSATASKVEGGVRIHVSCVGGQAYYYTIEWGEGEESKSLSIRSQGTETEYLLEGVEATSFVIRPLAKGYVENGAAVNVKVGEEAPDPDQGDSGEGEGQDDPDEGENNDDESIEED